MEKALFACTPHFCHVLSMRSTSNLGNPCGIFSSKNYRQANWSKLSHTAADPVNSYTKRPDLAPNQNGDSSNRLQSVTVGSNPATSTLFAYQYDNSGNMIQETLSRFYFWDHADRMVGFKIQNGIGVSVDARYLYGADGMRVKKWVRTNGTGNGDSRVYIDGIFEYHQWKKVGQPTTKENNRLHVMDNQSRIAIWRIGDSDDQQPHIQYQLGDHLCSSNLVIGGATASDNGLINREEYFPYGETSFGSFAKKRYRFTGKERDEESGLYYHGARYYAPWLARWVSCDPAGIVSGANLYRYASENPINRVDSIGLQDKPTESALQNTLDLSHTNNFDFNNAKRIRSLSELRSTEESKEEEANVEESSKKYEPSGIEKASANFLALAPFLFVAPFMYGSPESIQKWEQGLDRIRPFPYKPNEAGFGKLFEIFLLEAFSAGLFALASSAEASAGVARAAVPAEAAGEVGEVATEGVLQTSRTVASRGLTPGDLRNIMGEFIDTLPETARDSVTGWKTIAIALVEDAEGYQHLVYTVNGNYTNRAISQAAEQLGLERWLGRARAGIRGASGAPGDAEQLLLAAVEENPEYQLLAVVPSRAFCLDCVDAIRAVRGVMPIPR